VAAAEETATRAAASVAEAEGEPAAAEFVADAADAMWVASSTPRVWSLATCGLSYCRMRRDTTWARLMVYDIERREAADPQYPGIPLDSAMLWAPPGVLRHSQHDREWPRRAMVRVVGLRSREDVLAHVDFDPIILSELAGEYCREVPMLERATAAALEHGQIALATFHLTSICRLHVTLGDLEASRSTYARAAELYERVSMCRGSGIHAYASSYQISATGEG
jgi:hypothetical protein